MVAVNKPSGLLVHRSPIDKRETRFALQTLRNQLGRHVYPVHRLDKPTSGVLLFALTPDIASRLCEQWSDIDKRYLAITRGRLQSTELKHPIRTICESSRNPTSDKIQAAETHFKALAYAQLPVVFGKRSQTFSHTTFSLVEAAPKTGRKHQIRKHLKHLNHPIIGDTRHGRGEINRYFRQHFQTNRLMLHCQQLHLIHPVTAMPLNLYAPLDSTWHYLLGRLAWNYCHTARINDS